MSTASSSDVISRLIAATSSEEENTNTYVVHIGSGQCVVDNADFLSDEITIIQFEDVASTELTAVKRVGNDLILDYGTSDSITIENYFLGFPYAVSKFEFSDGVIFAQKQLFAAYPIQLTDDADKMMFTGVAEKIKAGAGDDYINGMAGDDTLDGGTGNDTLAGGMGNDTYIFRLGSGQDVIRQADSASDRADTISFEDVTSTALTAVKRVGNDLILEYGASDSITIQKYFLGASFTIDSFKFSDGVTFTSEQLFAAYPIELSDSADYFIFSAESEVVHGGDGDDVLNGGAGDDRLYGEEGEDFILGGKGDDYLDGGTQDDVLIGDEGNDTLIGGDGIDMLLGGKGNDSLKGEDGNDSLYAGKGNNILDGGTGNDTIVGGQGNDTFIFRKGSGQDVIRILANMDNSTDLSDTIKFEDVTSTELTAVKRVGGNLILEYGSSDSVTINGFFLGASATVKTFVFSDSVTYTQEQLFAAYPIQLTDHAEFQVFTGVAETIKAGGGNDMLLSNGGDDKVYGEGGNDTLAGGAGDDSLDGGDDNDVLAGSLGNDSLSGGAGVDQLYGAGGDDTLDGGAGNDTLDGGLGDDTFVFRTGSGQDVIIQKDFSLNHIDKIRFEDVASTGLTAVKRNGDALILEYGTSDSITIQNFYSGTSHAIDQFEFSDGVTYTQSQLFDAYTVEVIDTEDDYGLFLPSDWLNFITGSNNSVTDTGDLQIKSSDNSDYAKLTAQINTLKSSTECMNVSDGCYVSRLDIENIVNILNTINSNAGIDAMKDFNAMLAENNIANTLVQTWRQS